MVVVMATNFKNLFLRQSYLDSYDDYKKSLYKESYPQWDYIILTASNTAQADAYTEQINYRLAGGKLPKSVHYAVLPDPDGKRVGSGGATLNVLKYVKEHSGRDSFEGLKILVIHSGGDSKRVPQYSACGKLFSPVPRSLPDGRPSTLFDEFIIGMTGVPGRITDGMLVASGDVLLLFNPLQIDFYSIGAAVLSIREDAQIGKNHGVFLRDENGNVGRFLHKQSIEKLTSVGAVNQQGKVNIDTGAAIFDSNILNDLYSLINTDKKFDKWVNEKARLSFYGDFLYPLASKSSLEEFYKEEPEGEFCDELLECRKELWEKLHKYNMKLICFSPASFIHFGTTKELLKLVNEEIEEYKFLDWSRHVNSNTRSPRFASHNSYISPRAKIGSGSYIENSYVHSDSDIGNGCVISGVTVHGESIPENTVLHGLKLKDGRFVVRMYGVNDNPKEPSLFGKELSEPLWTAKLFPVCDTPEEALSATLSGEIDEKCLSLQESFNEADISKIILWQNKLDEYVKVEKFIAAIDKRIYVEKAIKIFSNGISDRAKNMLLDEAESADFSTKIRIYYYLSRLYNGQEKESLEKACFETIREIIMESGTKCVKYDPNYKIQKDEVVTKLPVRVNWGGGWSDTPPYCNEHGGTVINAAITINGGFPIEVVIRKIPERKIILESADYGAYKSFTKVKDIQDCTNNPHDPFALHKAALIACGIIPFSDDLNLTEILDNLGGGIYLSTQVINIPRGSGLGTSSILAGACVKGIFEFLGADISELEIYNRVLCMEQIMSTGGGWQDQVGGLLKGIKTISSKPGLNQKITYKTVNVSEDTLDKLSKRFCIIYTGQRRLARNLLREVVGKYIGSDPDALFVLSEIQEVALKMQKELEKGNINEFASLLNQHWELSKKLDQGCTNTCIDQIFGTCEELIDGKMICGAGGGGFLQVILKENVTIDDLNEQLISVFGDSGVEVWKCEFWT